MDGQQENGEQVQEKLAMKDSLQKKANSLQIYDVDPRLKNDTTTTTTTGVVIRTMRLAVRSWRD